MGPLGQDGARHMLWEARPQFPPARLSLAPRPSPQPALHASVFTTPSPPSTPSGAPRGTWPKLPGSLAVCPPLQAPTPAKEAPGKGTPRPPLRAAAWGREGRSPWGAVWGGVGQVPINKARSTLNRSSLSSPPGPPAPPVPLPHQAPPPPAFRECPTEGAAQTPTPKPALPPRRAGPPQESTEAGSVSSGFIGKQQHRTRRRRPPHTPPAAPPTGGALPGP